jgi:DNA repair protein RadD
VNISASADAAALVVDDAPVVETFRVDSISYALHKPKDDRPPSLKVTYHCGLRIFKEWVCFEHQGYARRKAVQWWRSRNADFEEPVPTKVSQALELSVDLFEPSEIKVVVNRKYPEIVGYEFGEGKEDIEEPF